MKAFLKLSLALLVFAAMAFPVSGQIITRNLKDSTANSATKNITFPSTTTGTTGIFLSGLKVSGTVSGYAILQVRTDTLPTAATSVFEDMVYPGTSKRDTLFFTDVATIQQHTWPIPFNYFNGARLKIVTSGTQKIYLYAGYIRR
jgi:hypothetical protein